MCDLSLLSLDLEFRSLFAQLSGVLTLAFFIHNCIITLMKNNKHQENNVSVLRRSTITACLLTWHNSSLSLKRHFHIPYIILAHSVQKSKGN